MSPIEAQKKRRPAPLTDKQAELEDEILEEPKAKKNRMDDRILIIATLDNGIMVEVFKHLNYSQLANNSFVSKGFWNVISTHRHSLARLIVDRISMNDSRRIIFGHSDVVKIFNRKLSPEAYNEWVICNQYSKQLQNENQVAGKQKVKGSQSRAHNKGPTIYILRAYAAYKDPYHRQLYRKTNSDSASSKSDSLSSNSDSESYNSDSDSAKSDSDDSTSILFASVKLNRENWPLFQHFVRLLTDPFIYVRQLELAPQNDVLNLLTGAIDSNGNRLQCEHLVFDYNGNVQQFMSWIKDHMRCKKVVLDKTADHFKPLLDFFATAFHCTSAIETNGCSTANLSKVVNIFVQKFIELKSSDECQMVESIQGSVPKHTVDTFKRNYSTSIVKDETDCVSCHRVFEFVNNNTKKKLQLIFSYQMNTATSYSLKIQNL